MSRDVVIRAEGLGKRYVIGRPRERYSALRDELASGARRLASGAVDILRGRGLGPAADTRTFWALKDVSFELRRGEVLGVIGRNGAGKSTLLKLLSRITEPSEGRATIDGRVASLLEVGTGFHPELTGRENIYLNGAILGMTHAEIRRKFDEIIDFSGVETFLDTPVKRYSSGMQVRLAFSVAAHLEPEILVVDEVLAVGDAEFQRKCMDKMGEVAGSGRTILFVSHNMAAINALTSRCLLLAGGRLQADGDTSTAVAAYLRRGQEAGAISGRGVNTMLVSAALLDAAGEPTQFYTPGAPLTLEVVLETDGERGLSLECFLNDPSHNRLGFLSLAAFAGAFLPTRPGLYRLRVALAPLWLASGVYTLDLATSVHNARWDHVAEGALELEVPFANPGGLTYDHRHSGEFGSLSLKAEGDWAITELRQDESGRRVGAAS